MLLFRSEEHVTKWSKDRGLPRGGEFRLDQMWRVAREWYAGRLSPDWKPRRIEESQAILERAGLTGDFWDLQRAR